MEPDELVAATIYIFTIPMAQPDEASMQIGEDPYILMHQHTVSAGMYYYRITVSNLSDEGEEQESDHSNEVSKECK